MCVAEMKVRERKIGWVSVTIKKLAGVPERVCVQLTFAVNTGGNATQQMEESYKNNTTSAQMLQTLASLDPFGYPECRAKQT